MKVHLATRKYHYWVGLAIALPALVVLSSGVLLQLKKQVPWVQPVERRGTAEVPSVTFEQVLAACRSVPAARVRTWEDISRVDVRPSRGILKVTAKNNWEVQVDAQTGAVLQAAYRRSDLIEAIHDGSFFHEQAKLWVFLPSGVLLLTMLLTGLYLFWLPIGVRRRKRRQLVEKASRGAAPPMNTSTDQADT
jgi:uncharacterized iron-regulated membrane protein